MTGNYLAVAGSALYYEIEGNLNGKPVVMLHGGLGSSADFAPIRKYLTADYKLISIDFRGHGHSALAGAPLSYAQHQLDVEHILAYLGVSQYALIGFSDGGIVGYRLAANRTNKVTSLITIGSQWRLEADDPSIEVLSGLTPEYWGELFPDDVKNYHTVNPAPDFDKLVAAVKSMWLDTSTTGYPNQQVNKIQCPVLIMRGDNDFLLSLSEAVMLKDKLNNAAFANIPFSAHAVHQESPELVGIMMQQFLTSYFKG